MAALGLKWAGEQPDEDCAVWPENWQAVQVFLAMRTQWRVVTGMSSVYWQGLDYSTLHVVEQRLGVARADRADCFNRLQVLEAEAVQLRNRKR